MERAHPLFDHHGRAATCCSAQQSQLDVSLKRSNVFLIAIINERVRIGTFSPLVEEIDEFDELIDSRSRCSISSSCCCEHGIGVMIRRHD